MELIKTYQKNLIECDNINCDYVVINPTGSIYEDASKYIDKPCPICGYNLLTKEDYKQSKSIERFIKIINFLFGWTSIFFKDKDYKEHNIKVHNGIKITE